MIFAAMLCMVAMGLFGLQTAQPLNASFGHRAGAERLLADGGWTDACSSSAQLCQGHTDTEVPAGDLLSIHHHHHVPGEGPQGVMAEDAHLPVPLSLAAADLTGRDARRLSGQPPAQPYQPPRI